MANPGIGATFDPNDKSSWYFGNLTRDQSTKMLLQQSESGVFLVRDSQSIAGDYVLCVREDDKVSHYIINRKVTGDRTTEFKIGDQVFSDMPALLAFYRLHYLDKTPLVRPLAQNIELVVAMYDFDGTDDEDLPFRRGERLMIINKEEDEWWTAKNSQGRTGSIPVNYVQRLLDPSRGVHPPAEALAQFRDCPAHPPLPPHANRPTNGTSMQRPLPAKAIVRQTRVPNAYDKTALKLEKGDIITVTKVNINGQWEGELNGKVGHFPFTYVQFIDDNTTS